MNEYKTGQVAERLDVHANTIRDWSDRYAALLSTRATGAKRKYTDDDLLILATVADMRDKGLSFEVIEDALNNGQRIEAIPEIPTKEEIEARENVALVPLPEYERALDAIKRLETEYERAIQERDNALDDRDKWQAKVIELERDLGHAKGQLQAFDKERKPNDYWLIIVLIVFISTTLVVAGVLFSVLQ